MSEKPDPKELEALLTRMMTKKPEPPDPPESQGQGQERVIEAEKILLRDESGRSRGKISANQDGSAGLILSDNEGTAWAWLGVNQEGEAFLELKDKKGEISFKVPAAGTPLSEAPAVAPVLPASDVTPEASVPSSHFEEVSQQPALPAEEVDAPESKPEASQAIPPPFPSWKPSIIDTELYDRVEALEQQNRGRGFFRTILLGLLALILATQAFVFFRPQSTGGPLEVQSLMVRDQRGTIRAWLGERSGKLALDLKDQQGKLRAALGLGTDGSPALVLYDEKQRVRAELQLWPNGEPRLNLRDESSLQGKTEQHTSNDPDNQLSLAAANRGDEDGTMASPRSSQEEAAARDVAGGTTFVGSKTSNRYHYPSCRWARTIHRSRLIKFNSAEEAQGRNYIPCPVCKPPPLSK